jgi:hypothetical protein
MRASSRVTASAERTRKADMSAAAVLGALSRGVLGVGQLNGGTVEVTSFRLFLGECRSAGLFVEREFALVI